MRYWVGITDYDWFSFLAVRPELPELNFWQPSAGRRPVTLEPGALFLFKLHASHGGFIVGGGFFDLGIYSLAGLGAGWALALAMWNVWFALERWRVVPHAR